MKIITLVAVLACAMSCHIFGMLTPLGKDIVFEDTSRALETPAWVLIEKASHAYTFLTKSYVAFWVDDKNDYFKQDKDIEYTLSEGLRIGLVFSGDNNKTYLRPLVKISARESLKDTYYQFDLNDTEILKTANLLIRVLTAQEIQQIPFKTIQSSKTSHHSTAKQSPLQTIVEDSETEKKSKDSEDQE